jgi:hypothetical protein
MKQVIIAFICLLVISQDVVAQEKLVVQPAVKEVMLSGYTRSDTTMVVSSEVGGRIIEANYGIGQKIGEKPFYRIDKTFINLDILNTRKAMNKLDVSTDQIRSRVAYLTKEFNRIDTLFRENSAAENKRDASAEELSQAKLEQRSIEVEKSMTQLRLQELTERRRRYDIRAPKNWIVVGKMAETGEVVSPNTPLARVADFENLVVPLSVSDRELDVIQQLPDVFDATLEGEPVKASLHRINPEFDERTRKLAIELILPDYEGEKRGGLVFNLELITRSDGLQVPKAAIISRYENPKVVLKETGETVQVLVLGETDGYVIIAEHPSLTPGTVLNPAE